MTIKDIKKIIENLPEDMEVFGYNGGNGDLLPVSFYTSTKHEGKEEREERIKSGKKATLIVAVD